jgi:hypothetical protein
MKLVRGIFAALLLGLSFAARAEISVGVSVNLEPPPLPIYSQPPLPAAGYVWMPGYWAWGEDDYYWVPGTWVEAPEVGLLWTPGWWGWNDGAYLWHAGYWGPQVGFYGGIDYGFGYSGRGYEGGYWQGDQLYYNRSVTNITNTTNITNVYNKTVVNTSQSHVSYNGGQGGISAQPSPQERAAERGQHVAPTAVQTRHQQMAASNRELRASANAGKPPVAATAKPAEFSGANVVAARAPGGPVRATAPAQQNGRANPNDQRRGAETVQQQRGQDPRAQSQQEQRLQQQDQRAQAQQEQRARAAQGQRVPQDQRTRVPEDQRVQAQQEQRARAPQEQRAPQDQRARVQEDQRAPAQQEQRARAPQEQRAQTQQPPSRTREVQAPAERSASPNESPNSQRRDPRASEQDKRDQNPRQD